MKFISKEQIQESLATLRPYNAFFCTSFLVLKNQEVPIGAMKRFSLDAANRDFLIENFRIHPKSEQFFRVMRQGSRTKDWVNANYASTGLQSVNTRGFHQALLHERYDDAWGWTEDYVERLVEKLPRRRRIPLLHLAVWLYKSHEWDDATTRFDIVERAVSDYYLTSKELEMLFLLVLGSNLSEEQAFQQRPVEWHELLAPYSLPGDVPADTSGILTYLETESIGPARKMVFSPTQRLNLITGDNGLGKTFLLDLAWWALTQDWVDLPATPNRNSQFLTPEIKFKLEGVGDSQIVSAKYQSGAWNVGVDRPVVSGLVVYARVDGSFAIWDPANESLARATTNSWAGIKFTREEVWNGKYGQIEGLIRDLVRWQLRKDRDPEFETFQSVLEKIYPPDFGTLAIGNPIRIPDEPREIPTLSHPYGPTPVVFESAGIRRILTLAYLLVWVWKEHRIQAALQNRVEEHQMVVLLDEAEAHLHPKWQRSILPGLLNVASELHSDMSVQWFITSHSPLVLASVESNWDRSSDQLYHFDIDANGNVDIDAPEFEKRGAIDSWLSSPIFELRQPGSSPRESAIQEAIRVQEVDNPSKAEIESATSGLTQHLASEDPFWVRWIFFARSYGVDV